MFLWSFFIATTSLGKINASKKALTKQTFDPLLSKMPGKLVFDEETKQALANSKIPGVLLADKEEADKIHRIEIIGAQKTETDAVFLQMVSKINGPYDSVLIASDIRKIMEMGLFSEVSVYQNILASKAIELRYELKEIPTIFQVKISGNEELSETEIKETISGLETYNVAKPERINKFAEIIRQHYIAKGYYLAEVDYEIKSTSLQDIKKREADGFVDSNESYDIDTARVNAPDFVDVIFLIKENSKVRINRISFMGNYYLSDDTIKAELRSQENHLLSVISDWGNFRPDFLEIDMAIIEKMLHEHGFLQAKILSPQIRLSPDKSFIDIAFTIIENKQYTLGSVSVSGDLIEESKTIYEMKQKTNPDVDMFLASTLALMIEQKQGDIFNKTMMANNVLAIAEKYYDIGYPYANIMPIPSFDEDNSIVDINVKITSGPKIVIERIDIEGNEKTKDEVIRREMIIFEGDYYSSSLLRISEQNINRLGYFETVEVSNKPGSTSETMIITIKVKEQSTGNIQAGAGYGTGGEQFIMKAQISNQNLFGRGQTLSASLNWSNYRRMFDISFMEPNIGYLFDNPVTFAFTAYNRDMYLGEFNRKATGGDITLGYPIGAPFAHISRGFKQKVRPSLMPYVFDFEALSLFITYTGERVQIEDPSTHIRIFDLYQNVPRYTTSLKPTIRLDQRDNRIFPTRGIYAEYRIEFSSQYLGAASLSTLENFIRQKNHKHSINSGLNYKIPDAMANNFIRYTSVLRFYHNLDDWFFWRGLVLKSNFEIGMLNNLGKEILFENYALGGSHNLRGYYYRSISPVERIPSINPSYKEQYFRVGGVKELHGSLELEFPIIKPLKISGVMFFDYGNVYSAQDNFFYIGGKSKAAEAIKPSDPLGIYRLFGLYSSVGFGVRWLAPMLGYLRFEWGFPLNRRPYNTPGLLEKDRPVQFEFNIGPSF